MGNGTDILDVVKCLSLLISRNTTSRFARVDALQNTEPAEVLDGDLQHLQTPGTSNEGSLQTSVVLLLSLSHPRKLALRSHLGMAGSLDGLFLLTSLYSISHGCGSKKECSVPML